MSTTAPNQTHTLFAQTMGYVAATAALSAFGLLIGLAVAPTIAYYGSMDPRALWQAGRARRRCWPPRSSSTC